VAHQYTVTLGLQMPAQGLDHIDRAMLAAGAAHGDGEIAAPVGLEARDPAIQKPLHIRAHLTDLAAALQKRDHRRIASAQATQVFLPMGIRQAAHIEDEVDPFRHTVLEAKRLQQHRGLHRTTQALANEIAQLVHIGVGGVDADFGDATQRLEQLAFALDGFGQRQSAPGEWMLAPGLAEAIDECMGVRMEKDNAASDPLLTQLVTESGQIRQDIGLVAGIDADGRTLARLTTRVEVGPPQP
jgi:hypothetical protein